MNWIRLTLWLAAAIVIPTSAQTLSDPLPKRGLQPTGVYAVSDIETINQTNGNLVLSIPLVSLGPNPLGGTPGLSLVYNSKLWDPASVETTLAGTSVVADGIKANPDGEWSYGVGYEIQQFSREHVNPPATNPCTTADCDPWVFYFRTYVVFPDGSKHLLRLKGPYEDRLKDGHYLYNLDGRTNCAPNCTYNRAVGKLVYYTNDGSYVRVEVQLEKGAAGSGNYFNASENNPWTIYFRDGSRVEGGSDPATGGYRAQKRCDRNNNCSTMDRYVRYDSGGFSLRPAFFQNVKDDYGRQITIEYGGNYHTSDAPYTDSIKATIHGGTELEWKLEWSAIASISRDYICRSGGQTTSCAEYVHRTGFGLTEIKLPTQSGLSPYKFEYNAKWGELSKVELPSGASVTYTYMLDSGSGCSGYQDTPDTELVLANYVCKKTVTYANQFGAGNLSEPTTFKLNSTTGLGGGKIYESSELVGPDGGLTKTYFYPTCYGCTGDWRSGLVYKIEHPDGSITEKTWQQNELPGTRYPSNDPTYPNQSRFPYDSHNPYVSLEKVTVQRIENSNFVSWYKATQSTLDRNGNVLQTWEYDFGKPATGNGPLLRNTVFQYNNGTTGAASYTATDETNVFWNSGAPKLLNQVANKRVVMSPVSARTDYCYTPSGDVRIEVQSTTSTASSLVDCATGVAETGTVANQFIRATNGNLLKSKDARGVWTKYEYDSNTLYLTKRTEACNTDGSDNCTLSEKREWTFLHDFYSGKPTQATDANSASITTIYDVFGRPTSVTDPAKTVTTEYKDAQRYVQTTTTGGGITVDRIDRFDQLGRVWLTQTSDNGTLSGTDTNSGIRVETRHEYFAGGRYEFVSTPYRKTPQTGDPDQGWTRRKYDAVARLVEEASFSGSAYPGTGAATTKAIIDYNGQSRTLKDEAANATNASNPGSKRTIEEDALGRVVKVEEEGGDTTAQTYTTTYSYNPLDLLTGVQQNGRNRTFIYDALGRLQTAINPESGTIEYSYDANGNLLRKSLASGAYVCYNSTADGNCSTLVSYAANAAYDGLNRPKAKNESGGLRVAYAYDEELPINGAPAVNAIKGRLSKVTASTTAGTVSETTYRYDSAGRIAASLQRTDAQDYRFLYGYNAMGLTSVTYPSDRVVTYVYDAGGRVSAVKRGATEFYASGILYSPHGGMKSMQYGTALAQTIAYNYRLQPTTIEAKSGTTTPLKLEYDYGTTENNGNILSQKITRTGMTTVTQTYQYRRLNLLKKADEGLWNETYGYDQWGNRWVESAQGVNISSFTPRDANWFNALNRMVNTPLGIGHDAAGHQTQIGAFTFSYDGEGRQKTSTNSGTVTDYLYDGEGRRVVVKTGSKKTIYVYDATGQLAAEYGDTPTETGLQYMVADHLGSTRLVKDAEGAGVKCLDYRPFGEELSRAGVACYDAASSLKVKFTGQVRDSETASSASQGLDYFGARYFSGAQGRFTSPDPFNPIVEFRAESDDPDDVEDVRRRFDEHISNPHQWNQYAYALNNPTKFIDRDGKVAVLPILAAAWAIYEVGSAIYDAYTAYKTVQDPNATKVEKSIAVAGLGISLLAPGGGYGTGGKRVAKEILEASGAQMHHIATNKNILGGFTKQFQRIFDAAGLSLDDGINKIILRGHANVKHTKEYHQYILRRLTDATQGLKAGSQQYRNAVHRTLEDLRRELLDNPDMISWTVF